RRERIGIRRRRAQRLLPAFERLDVILARTRELREPLEKLRALGRRRRRRRVILERLLEPRIAGLLEYALHAIERVAIALQQLEPRPPPDPDPTEVGEPGLVEQREPAQLRQPLGTLRDRPLLRRILRLAGADHRVDDAALVELEHAAQCRCQARIVALA